MILEPVVALDYSKPNLRAPPNKKFPGVHQFRMECGDCNICLEYINLDREDYRKFKRWLFSMYGARAKTGCSEFVAMRYLKGSEPLIICNFCRSAQKSLIAHSLLPGIIDHIFRPVFRPRFFPRWRWMALEIKRNRARIQAILTMLNHRVLPNDLVRTLKAYLY